MPKYNGHRSWNAWNVSLWINNTESLYKLARYYVKCFGVERAVVLMYARLPEETPDGAKYNKTCIREALRGILK